MELKKKTMVFFLWMCLVVTLSHMFQVKAISGGYKFHEALAVEEYSKQQGFEAKLVVSSTSEDDTFGSDINPLTFIVRIEKSTQLRVYISDAVNPRWEIPDIVIPRQKINSKIDPPTEPPILSVTYTTKPFGFAVTRISTGDVLFNSTPPIHNSKFLFNPLVFKDQYIEISTQLPKSNTIFGLGESTTSDGLKLKHNKTYTLWTTDIPALLPNVGNYGAWPFYIDVREGGVSHGVLFLNSNGMEITYNETSLTYRVIGGVLDFYFFPGPTPLDIMDQFTQLVGRPAAQPYWSFGYHQCRWGYRNISIVKEVVEKFKEARIPLDTMWNDIDYQDRYMDFTHDDKRFPLREYRAFIDKLHNDGQHYMMMTDPGIGIAYDDYKTYTRGLEEDIYLKTANGERYVGQVWPGPVYYPDFFHPNATRWWTNEVQLFHDQLPFDGMWIDMNELSNFCSGTQCSWNGTIMGGATVCYLQCTETKTKYDDPPFKINHYGRHDRLNYLAASMTAVHWDGTIEYNAHSLYGLAEAIATNAALITVRKKRPFVLSRSTFVGSGAHTAHWTGDNKATFEEIGHAIVTVMNSGMAGIPMVGADIGGFYNVASEDLFSRWVQTGALHPFSRAHTDRRTPPKEMYLFKKVAIAARKALGLKYQLLPYYYTLMWEAHTKGYPMVRPLFMVFPNDPKTLNVSYQFLLGNHILVSPVITENATSVEAYIPKGTWWNILDHSSIISEGKNFTLNAPWNMINVHVHEGSIIPMQGSALTTTAVRRTPFTLVVALASNSVLTTSHGYVFLDNGEEIDMVLKANQSTLVTFEAVVNNKIGLLTTHVQHGEYALKEGWYVHRIVILGVDSTPNVVLVNGKVSHAKVKAKSSSVLVLSGLKLPLGKEFEIGWGFE